MPACLQSQDLVVSYTQAVGALVDEWPWDQRLRVLSAWQKGGGETLELPQPCPSWEYLRLSLPPSSKQYRTKRKVDLFPTVLKDGAPIKLQDLG